MSEKFNPSDDKYKKVEDLPEPLQNMSVFSKEREDLHFNAGNDFVDLEAGGFARRSAVEDQEVARERVKKEEGYLAKIKNYLGMGERDQQVMDLIHGYALEDRPINETVNNEALLLRDSLLVEAWEKMREVLPYKGDRVFYEIDSNCKGGWLHGVIDEKSIKMHRCNTFQGTNKTQYEIDGTRVTENVGMELWKKLEPIAIRQEDIESEIREFQDMRLQNLSERGGDFQKSKFEQQEEIRKQEEKKQSLEDRDMRSKEIFESISQRLKLDEKDE